MRLQLKIWRQAGPQESGAFERYELEGLRPDLSLLEALDVLNERLVHEGKRPVAFDSDCREGICGACGIMVAGYAHGPSSLTTSCELRLRAFESGAEVTLEPFRAAAFPLIADLMVDRSVLDRVIQAGGYVSVRTGSAPEANSIAVSKAQAEHALDAAACIGCGACVAACPNGSAALFIGAKLAHLAALPQGRIERGRRALRMVQAADEAGLGPCSQHGECAASCPKGIRIGVIAGMNRDAFAATLRGAGREFAPPPQT